MLKRTTWQALQPGCSVTLHCERPLGLAVPSCGTIWQLFGMPLFSNVRLSDLFFDIRIHSTIIDHGAVTRAPVEPN
jgi:hypothetical protein